MRISDWISGVCSSVLLIPIFVGLVALVDAFGFGKAGGVGEIILGKAIALGREELEEAPAAGPPPRLEPRQWRARDDVERHHLVGVAGGAVDRVEQVRAAVARPVAPGAVHVALADVRGAALEQFGTPDLFRGPGRGSPR